MKYQKFHLNRIKYLILILLSIVFIPKVNPIVNPTSSKDMGLIMKEVSPKLKGRADMSFVSKSIRFTKFYFASVSTPMMIIYK